MLSTFKSGKATKEEIAAENRRCYEEDRRRRVEAHGKKVCLDRPFGCLSLFFSVFMSISVDVTLLTYTGDCTARSKTPDGINEPSSCRCS